MTVFSPLAGFLAISLPLALFGCLASCGRPSTARADVAPPPASPLAARPAPVTSPPTVVHVPPSPPSEAKPARPETVAARASIGAPFVSNEEPTVAARHQRSRALAAAAAKNGGPDRFLTPLASIPPYDRARFIADPESYLSEAVPARALRDAVPGSKAPGLELDGPGLRPATVGQPVAIRVQAVPGAPVSFFSSDLAQADNGLSAISVQAGPDGWATAQYTPQPGAVDDAHISIASPETFGVLRVTLSISYPVAPQGLPHP